MRFLHHCLGAKAKANSVLWQNRVNGVPYNIPAILFLSVASMVDRICPVDAPGNSKAPLDRIHSELHSGVWSGGASGPLEYGEAASNRELKTVETSWFPLHRRRFVSEKYDFPTEWLWGDAVRQYRHGRACAGGAKGRFVLSPLEQGLHMRKRRMVQ